MFEALLLAASQAATPAAAPPAARVPPPASAAPPARIAPPSAELLEFLADWNEDEAGLLDEISNDAPAPRAPVAKSPAAKP